MRINAQQSLNWLLNNEREQKVQESETNKLSSTNVTDEIQLNVTAEDFEQFFQWAKESDQMREEKVQTLKAQYENGTYMVTGKEVIEKIVGEKS